MIDMIVFDMDETLTPSRDIMAPEMADAFSRLLEKYKVGILTGGDFSQITSQVLDHIEKKYLSNLFLSPTCGAKLYSYLQNEWQESYRLEIDAQKREEIVQLCREIYADMNIMQNQPETEILEDRETMITIFIYPKDAPIEEKRMADPDKSKRKKIRDRLMSYPALEGFALHIA